MSVTNLPVGGYKQTSASGNIQAKSCILLGIFCSSSTSGTATVYDDAGVGTTTKAVDTFNLTAGTWYPLPIGLGAGCNLVLGGTASVTVVFA
jgi:hypothetical protein